MSAGAILECQRAGAYDPFTRSNPSATAPPRRSFEALIDLTDIQSEKHLAALTNDLSLFGCSGKAATPFPEGIKVRLMIWHAGTSFVALGRVVYSRADWGMGIAFTAVEPSSVSVLDAWLASLRK